MSAGEAKLCEPLTPSFCSLFTRKVCVGQPYHTLTTPYFTDCRMLQLRGGVAVSVKLSDRQGKFDSINTASPDPFDDWLEKDVWGTFRRWHVIFMFCSGFLSLVVCVCCCCRFRIPRTKQEIEADHIRKKLTRKFRRQLKLLQNSEMDEMDLKRALDRIREEFKSDTESLAQSEAFSIRSLPRSRPGSPLRSYRKASEIGLDIDDLISESDQPPVGSRYSRVMHNTMSLIRKNKTPISINA